MTSQPKAPAKTAEQEAAERRTRSLLDKEIEESEGRFKALARGKLGRVSLLSGASATPEGAATTKRTRPRLRPSTGLTQTPARPATGGGIRGLIDRIKGS